VDGGEAVGDVRSEAMGSVDFCRMPGACGEFSVEGRSVRVRLPSWGEGGDRGELSTKAASEPIDGDGGRGFVTSYSITLATEGLA